MRSKKTQMGATAALICLATSCLAVSCRFEPPAPPPVGVPAQSDARCQVLHKKEIARAQSVFSCRGALEPAADTMLGAFRASRGGAYTLLRLDAGGEVLASGDTGHMGAQILLRTVQAGALAVSWGDVLRWSVHSPQLEVVSPLQQVALERPTARFYDVAVSSVPPILSAPALNITQKDPTLAQLSQGGALVAAATGFGVELWLLSGTGQVLHRTTALRHPEMPYCRKVELRPHERGWLVQLRCDEVVPMEPLIKQRRAQVPNFDYDARTPAMSDLEVVLGPSLLPLEVALKPAMEPEPPRRYALRRALDEDLPHPQGERVRTLDAYRTAPGQASALVCAGPDDGPVALYSLSARCTSIEGGAP
jgi:hypothetical protein